MSDMNPPQPHRDRPLVAPLDAERVFEILKGSQRTVVAWAKPNFDIFLSSFIDKILENSDREATNQQQSLNRQFQRQLLDKGHELSRHFCSYLGEGFIKFRVHKLDIHTDEEKYINDRLSPVDNAGLEETIAISSITQREENKYADLLWALNQRYALLNDGHKVSDKSNPIGPVQFFESLRKALKLFSFDTKVKLIAYQVFDEIFMSRLQEVLDKNNSYLQSSGLLANLRQSAMYKKPAATDSVKVNQSDNDAPMPLTDGVVVAPDPHQPSGQYQSSLVGAICTLQSHLAMNAGSRTDAPLVRSSVLEPHAPLVNSTGVKQTDSAQQLISVLQSFQLQAAQLFVSSELGGQRVTDFNRQLTQHLQVVIKDICIERSDIQAIELVGMLFEYIYSDENLPDSVKTLLSYLYTPFIKIVFLDKTFFTTPEHPARRLLNALAEAGARWVSTDGTSQYDMVDNINAVVSTVLDEFENDECIFTPILLDFSRYMKKLSRRQELMEKRLMEKVEGEDKLREVKIRVNTEIRSRTDKCELPSAVLL